MRDKSNIKICPVCKKEFECYPKPKANRPRVKAKKKSNAITCSKKCSRVYSSYRYKKCLKKD